jgi:hypothetical protein
MAEPERRRRRLRPSSSSASPAAVPATGDETAGTPAGPPMTEHPRPARTTPTRRPTSGAGVGSTDDREAERGLRGLVGSGSSQVSVGAAMRARDAARPTDEQLADADANLTIVRRNWQPREELPKR